MEIFVTPYNSVFEVKCVNILRQNRMPLQSPHFNPNYELIVVSEGPLYLQVEEEKLSLNVGDAFLLLPWQQHKFWKQSVSNGEFYWVQFQSLSPLTQLPVNQVNWEQFHQIARTNMLQIETGPAANLLLLPRSIHVQQKFKLLSLFEQLITELNEPQGNYLFRSSLLLGSMLELLSTSLIHEISVVKPLSKSHYVFCSTVLCLNNYYMKEGHKAQLENLLQRNYASIERVFKKYSGMTIVEYIQILRIQRAKYLLQFTRKTIKDISEEVGIKDSLYFSKVFKNIVGKQPTLYRHERSS